MVTMIVPPECKDNHANWSKIYNNSNRTKVMNSLYNHEAALVTIYLEVSNSLMISSTVTLAIEPIWIKHFNGRKMKQYQATNRMSTHVHFHFLFDTMASCLDVCRCICLMLKHHN